MSLAAGRTGAAGTKLGSLHSDDERELRESLPMSDLLLDEAARILMELGIHLPDENALARGRQKLAEALEAAERRGRMRAAQKEQSG